jgi:hypothetical protein
MSSINNLQGQGVLGQKATPVLGAAILAFLLGLFLGGSDKK